MAWGVGRKLDQNWAGYVESGESGGVVAIRVKWRSTFLHFHSLAVTGEIENDDFYAVG